MYEQGAAWDKIFMAVKKPHKKNFLTIVTNKDKKFKPLLDTQKIQKRALKHSVTKKFSTKVAKKLKKNSKKGFLKTA